jgi:Domain of unknown function (DUF4845)
MRQSQRGVTFIGWLFLLMAVGIVVYEGIRIAPLYLNYMRVAKSLDRLKDPTAAQAQAGATSAQTLRSSLGRSFEIESIEHPELNDIDIHRDGEHWAAVADYDDVTPLFGDLSLVVHFHKEVDVP